MANVHQFHKDYLKSTPVEAAVRGAQLYPYFERMASVSGMSSTSVPNWIWNNRSGDINMMIRPRTEEGETALLISQFTVDIDSVGTWTGGVLGGVSNLGGGGFEIGVFNGDTRNEGLTFSYNRGSNHITNNQTLVQSCHSYTHNPELVAGISTDGLLQAHWKFKVPLLITATDSLRIRLRPSATIPANTLLNFHAYGHIVN
jgi:hypothetical protein